MADQPDARQRHYPHYTLAVNGWATIGCTCEEWESPTTIKDATEGNASHSDHLWEAAWAAGYVAGVEAEYRDTRTRMMGDGSRAE